MSETTICPNCGTKIKTGMFGNNPLIDGVKAELLAEINGVVLKEGCFKCLGAQYTQALQGIKGTKADLLAAIAKDINEIPVITTHSPFNWEYTVLGIATGQTTTGTGLFSEAASTWTDLFGLQSNAYNRKISEGEIMCAQQVRAKAIEMGGNAVIATDIDYSELGGGKGMIMVCMSGTVVRLSNVEVLDPGKVESIKRLIRNTEKVKKIDNKYGEILE